MPYGNPMKKVLIKMPVELIERSKAVAARRQRSWNNFIRYAIMREMALDEDSASPPLPVREPHRAEGPGKYVGLRRMAHRQSERSVSDSLSADDDADLTNNSLTK